MTNNFLFVDDDCDDTELFCEALTEVDQAAKYHCACNGIEAIEKLEALGNAEVIFMDVNMPEMSGLECLSIIKGNPSYKDVPVLMYSTSANRQDVYRAKELGALCFITKPSDFKGIKNILVTVIQRLNSGEIEQICDDDFKLKDW